MPAFEDVFAVLGVLLVCGALIAGLAHRTFLSLTALFVVAGLILGRGGLEVLDFDPRSGFVGILAVVALILILFRDGLEVEAEMLQRAWRLPLRKLVLAMPITCGLVACATNALTDLSWTQSFLVGALLSPTDPVLSSSVVTNPRVPRVIRHSLNLESGLNDGLALPAVLAFAAALDPQKTDFVWWKFVLQDVTLGFAVGIALGFLAARLMPRSRSLGWDVTAHQKAMYGLGAAFATYAAAHAVNGNGLIAVFVCAITLGIQRADIRESFESRAEDIIEIVKLGIFVVFGAVLTLHGLFEDGAAAVAIVVFTLLFARPFAVFVSLLGTRTDTMTRLFMGWFGPKGVATMSFSLLVLGEGIADGERIFNIAALAVFVSIIAHGLTDTPGANLIARHTERSPA
ncbi:MAG: cation:proton antiporter [Thermoleophilaceae bacterium]